MPYGLYTIPALMWLVSCGAAAVALRVCFAQGLFRFQRAFVASIVALAVALYGLLNVHVAASRTVNGQLIWSINSKWFFLAALGLAAFSLGTTFWRRTKTPALRPVAVSRI